MELSQHNLWNIIYGTLKAQSINIHNILNFHNTMYGTLTAQSTIFHNL